MELLTPDGSTVSFPDGTSMEVAKRYISTYYPVEPNIVERTIGHLSKGMAEVMKKVSNVGSYLTGEEPTPGPYQQFFENNPFASAITAYPETSTLGQLAGGLVEFLPQVPIYTVGGRAVLGAASKLPAVGKYAESLLTPASTTMRRYGKAIARGAAEGGIVGTAIGTSAQTPIGEKLLEGGKEALGFGAATAVLHPAFAVLGGVGKAVVRRLRSKATVENVEAELKKKAETDPAAAEDLQKLQEAAKEEPEGLYVPKGPDTVVRKQGELDLEPIGKEQTEKLTSLGYTDEDIRSKTDEELINILDNSIEKPASTAADYQAEADAAGVKFNGIQEGYGSIKDFPFFTDPVTGTTFTLEEGETVVSALARKRQQFKEAEGDTQNIQRIQGSEQGREKPVEGQPVEGAGGETVSTSGDVQALEGTTAETKASRRNRLRLEKLGYTAEDIQAMEHGEQIDIIKNKQEKTITLYRGEGRNTGAPTEGEGLYAFTNREDAKGFGDVKEVIIKNPTKVIEADSLPVLQEAEDIFTEITDVDSLWMKYNKQALNNIGKVPHPEGGWYSIDAKKFGEELSTLLKKDGYDAVKYGDETYGWYVILDKGLVRNKGAEPTTSVQNLNTVTPETRYKLQRLGYKDSAISKMKEADGAKIIEDRIKNLPEPAPEEVVAAEDAFAKVQENAKLRAEVKADETRKPAPEMTPEREAEIEAEIERDLETIDKEPISNAADLIIKMQNHFDDATLDTLVDNLPISKEERLLEMKLALERRQIKVEAEKAGVKIEKPEAVKPAASESRAELDARLKAMRRRKKDTSSVQAEIDRYNKKLEEEGLGEELPPEEGGELIFDMLGGQQIYNFAKRLLGERKSQANAEHKRVIAEVNGKQLIARVDSDFVDGMIAKMGENLRRFVRTKANTPDFAYIDNKKMEPLIFDLHKKMYEGNFAASQRNETVRAAETTLASVESKERIRDILEGKTTEGSPEELEAARMVRTELDAVRDKYKAHLREDFKNNLNEDENAALAEIIAGRPVEEVIAKYKTHVVLDKLGRRRQRAWVDEEVIRDTAKEYADIDKWGLDDYVTHYERGPLRIVSGGRLYAKAMSEADAARKFADLVELYPDKEFQIDTKHNLEELATGLSKRSYNRLLWNMQNGLKKSIEGINSAAARRLAQKGLQGRFFIKPTYQFSPYTMDRREFLQGEKNVFDILYNYMYSMEKKMALDPAIDAARKAMMKTEVVGQESYVKKDGTTGTRDIKRPFLNEEEQAYLNRYIEDIKGRYYKGDEIVDGLLKNVGSQRLYSKAIQASRELEANLKLGYAPVKGLINAASGLGHIWTKTGTRYVAEGAAFLKTAEGKDFMKAMEPYLGVNIVESATGELSTRGTFERWGILAAPKTEFGRKMHSLIEPLGLFQAPELPVRKLTLAANYLMAKSSGMSEAAARDTAIKANWFQQFTYDMASLPEIMRSPTGRLLMQFKPYLLKEMEFISTLRGPEIARYIGMQLALGGPRGLVMIAKSLPILGMMQGWNELENWMNKEYPRASRGIGGALGVDITAPATFQFPASMKDWLGPTLSDITSLYKNVVTPLVDGHGLEGVEGMRAGSSIFPIIRHWRNVIEQVVDKDGWVKDERGRRLWHIDNTATFVAKSVAGAEPIELNRIRVAERNIGDKEKLLADQKTETIDDVLDAVAKGKPLTTDLIERMMRLGIKPSTLRRAAQFRVLDPKQRRLLMTEVIRRPDILEQYPDAGDLER